MAESPEPISITSTKDPRTIGQNIEYFIDSSSKLSLPEIRLNPDKYRWQKNTSETPNFGYTEDTVWLRFAISNASRETQSRIIAIGYPILDVVEFFLVKHNRIVKTSLTGDLFPFHFRSIAHRSFLFEASLDASEDALIYLRVRSSSSLQVPIIIAGEREFFIDDEKDLINQSIYYGMMIVMLMVNLFLFLVMKEIVYFYYIMFVFSFAGTIACLHGLPNQYLWPDHPYLQDLGILVLVPSIVMFASLFARKFLSLSEHAPLADKFFYGAALFESVGILGAFLLPYQSSIFISVASVVPVSICLLLIGPYLWRKGHVIARFYTLAWISITLAAIMLAFNKFGIIPRTFLTENGLQIGSAMEAILLSMALVDRLNRERDERLIAEEKVVQNALHNSLTGLPNRAFLENWVKNRIANQDDFHLNRFVLVHLQNFHAVTKTFGHVLSDELLEKIVDDLNKYGHSVDAFICLENLHGRNQYIASIDAVTFAFIVKASNDDLAKELVTKFVTKTLKMVRFRGMMIDVGAVAGISSFHAEADGWLAIRNAQIAIDIGLQEKRQVLVFKEDNNPYNERKLALAGELDHALENNELQLYFQPKICPNNRCVKGLEVLLRWHHKEYGYIAPDEFILIAEQTGIINELTDWVMENALSKLVQINHLGLDLNMAINISAINLRQFNFAERIESFINKYEIRAEQLSLELTETAMMDDPKQALSVLDKLHELGVRISIDDFGTGYSSLAYIKRLPVKEIKIDRSFVLEMNNTSGDQIIVKTTINMCHDLGYEVVAEGVESYDVCNSLQAMNCDFMQGYYFCRPLPFDDLVTWLSNENIASLCENKVKSEVK